MKTLIVLLSVLTCSSWAGPTILYVSESGENRIAFYAFDDNSGDLTRAGEVPLPGAPGSLALSANNAHLYASVRSTKQFATLAVDGKTGTLSNPVLTPPSFNASYVHVDKTGQWLLSASFSDGVAALNRIKGGIIDGPPTVIVKTGSYAHSIQTDAANRFAFVPHVLDVNKVEQLQFDATAGTLTPNTPPYLAGGDNEGPRHFYFHPNGRWVYFINENGKSVTLCDYHAQKGTLKARQTVTTVPPEWKTKGACADIHGSADGRFIYASNRGHDSIAVFAVQPDTGDLEPLGQTPTEKMPRSFCLMPGGENFVVAAGEGSHRLIVYRRDPRTGALTPLKTYDCGKGPAWVLGTKLQ